MVLEVLVLCAIARIPAGSFEGAMLEAMKDKSKLWYRPQEFGKMAPGALLILIVQTNPIDSLYNQTCIYILIYSSREPEIIQP